MFSDLLREAHNMGITVHVAYLDAPRLGYYDRALSQIVLAFGLSRIETTCVLAHELAHAQLGHTCTTGIVERRADQLAAAILINFDDYRRAEAICENLEDLADELGVTSDVVTDYQTLVLQRIGTSTYARPRMGRRQWSAVNV